jgi:SnoaL-like domain
LPWLLAFDKRVRTILASRIAAVAAILFVALFNSYMNPDTVEKAGWIAIEAWQMGEQTGNYDAFKKLIAKDFDQFAHPLVGRFTGSAALEKMMEVMATREKMPNNLQFSDINVAVNQQFALVSFHSKGKVMNEQYEYEGHNVISFKIENGKVKGFSEYLGDDDLLKFAALQQRKK